jgi:hypothetical protein
MLGWNGGVTGFSLSEQSSIVIWTLTLGLWAGLTSSGSPVPAGEALYTHLLMVKDAGSFILSQRYNLRCLQVTWVVSQGMEHPPLKEFKQRPNVGQISAFDGAWHEVPSNSTFL